MSPGAWILVVAVAVSLAFGGYRALTDGRFRGTRRLRGATAASTAAPGVEQTVPASVVEGTPWAEELGERFTLLQFSSAFCAPCRATRRVLADVATTVPGVQHVEVDAEQHLEVVRRLGIMRTPTTLILDARGAELSRASGLPRTDQVLAAMAGHAL
ncbi:MAG: thioredoxin family protein [Marmoricola sp.]